MPGDSDDLYASLGLGPGASEDDITRAYRRLARERHPDANPDAAHDAFSDLTDAYDVLRDATRRQAYDDTRTVRARAAAAARGTRVPVRHVRSPRPPSPPTAGAAGPAPAIADLELPLTFDQAALGTTAVVPIELEVECAACSGSGLAAADAPGCPHCGGTGATSRVSGGITIRRTCPACDGAGRVPPVPCDRCSGTGRAVDTREVTVRVPSGVDEGTRLRLPLPHAPDRDVFAVVRTSPHPYFGRRGHYLTVRTPVTLAEAALGAVVSVPTLTGALAIRIPAGTPPGRTLRVRGHGIPEGDRAGDLLVIVDVVVPTELNDDQRAALEAFGAATPSPRAHFETSAEAAG